MLVSLYSFGQFVLMLWSIRTHFDRIILILVNWYSCCNGNELTKMSKTDQKTFRKDLHFSSRIHFELVFTYFVSTLFAIACKLILNGVY